MKFQHCLGAMLAATATFGVLGISDASAWGRRGGGVPSPYYGPHPYYGYPYVNPYGPYYGVLPPPVLGYQAQYANDPYWGTRRPVDGPAVEPLDYVPRKRTSMHPAIPYTASPQERLEDLRRARFTISVPTVAAVVLFDGTTTMQTGLTRVFVTPPLGEDKLYSSTIEVRWTGEDGAKLVRTKTFDYVAGESITHRFSE
jgi:uncharacterized protein (TIGR03000 family)